VGRELLLGERADRLAQRLVLVGEDEVLALGAELGLYDGVGGGDGVSLVTTAGEPDRTK